MLAPRLLVLVAAAALPLVACDDTGIVLVVSSDRKVPAELDAFCLQVDAGGAPRFHKRADVTTFPQTLTVLPGGGDVFGASIVGLRQGVYVDDLRLRIGFGKHEIRDVQLPLGRCPPIATSGRYQQVDAPLAGAVPIVLDSAAGPRVLAWTQGAVAELAWNGTTLTPLAGANLPPAPAGTVTAFAAADLDASCSIDLVIGETAGPAHVWLHDGSGGFVELAGALPADLVAPHALAVADFDGDGNVDVVSLGPGARMFRGDGTGYFAEVQNMFVPAPANPTAAAAADLDGMLGPDLVVGQTGGADTLVYLNDGSGVLHSSPGALPPITLSIVGVAAVDVDGDGDRDVVLAHAGGIKLLLNRGDAYLEDGSFGRVPGGAMVAGVSAADLDRDCQMDLVLPTTDGTPILWAGMGGGALQPISVDGAAGLATNVSIGDVDGNGSRDVVLAGPSGGAVWIQQ